MTHALTAIISFSAGVFFAVTLMAGVEERQKKVDRYV